MITLSTSMRAAALSGLVLMIAASASDSAGARKKSEPCFPRGSSTEIQTSQVRVYRRGRSAVACALRTGRRLRLGLHAGRSNRGEFVAADLLVRGEYVAYVRRSTSISSRNAHATLQLVDLYEHRRVDIGSTGCEEGEGPGVHRFDLNVSGRLAWTCLSEGPNGTTVEVRKYDGDGPGVLDAATTTSGGGPIASSVALSDSENTVYWTRGSEPRSAELR